MNNEEIALSNEVCDELVNDFNACCTNAHHRLRGQLRNDHVANALLTFLFYTLQGYTSPARNDMIDHIITELHLLRAQP